MGDEGRSAAEPARNGLTYADAGVSIDAGAALVQRIAPAAASTARSGVMSGLGGFGAAFDLAATKIEDPVLVATTDGVGTKLRVGLETERLRGLGIDLVAMCVNDLVCQGAEPLFFLDYFATGALDVEQAAALIDGVAEGCREAGCALIGGETAEMPGLDAPGDFDVAGFAVGAASRSALLPRSARAGDVVIGLSSHGAHANGYSLIRRIVADAGLDWSSPAPFSASETLGAALIRPTRLYVREALALLRDPSVGASVRGFAHVTGGGLVENPPRALAPGLAVEIDLGAVAPPPVFDWLARTGGVDDVEMLRTFNCGVGFVAFVAEDAADAALSVLRAAGADDARRIGRVTQGDSADAPASTRFLGALFQ